VVNFLPVYYQPTPPLACVLFIWAKTAIRNYAIASFNQASYFYENCSLRFQELINVHSLFFFAKYSHLICHINFNPV
jgi:hypothetical protein